MFIPWYCLVFLVIIFGFALTEAYTDGFRQGRRQAEDECECDEDIDDETGALSYTYTYTSPLNRRV